MQLRIALQETPRLWDGTFIFFFCLPAETTRSLALTHLGGGDADGVAVAQRRHRQPRIALQKEHTLTRGLNLLDFCTQL
jgi:hypothetical protein